MAAADIQAADLYSRRSGIHRGEDVRLIVRLIVRGDAGLVAVVAVGEGRMLVDRGRPRLVLLRRRGEVGS